jgi:phosphosulfolactate synthase
MKRAFSAIDLPARPAKPRPAGVSMMIDWGLPLGAQADTLALAGEFIDLAKIAVGISGLIAEEALLAKIKSYLAAGVEPFPGGMYLELALKQEKIEAYYEECQRVGYRLIEISDNVVHFDTALRQRLIGNVAPEEIIPLETLRSGVGVNMKF